jgi:hypothetical protein
VLVCVCVCVCVMQTRPVLFSYVMWRSRGSLPSQAREPARVRQLNNEPNPVFKVGFIREKGKATAGDASR